MKSNSNYRGYEKRLEAKGVKLSKRHITIPEGCWMCGKNNIKMSKEHVIPDWLQEHFKIQGVQMNQAHLSSSGKVLDTREVEFASLTQGRICEKSCNNGWMSKLETDFQDLFVDDWKQGFKEKPIIFARWIAKTLTLINISQPRRVMIDAQGRHGLSNKERLPEGWSVYIYETSSDMPEIVTWEQGGVIMALLKTDSDLDKDVVERVFAGCIKVGDMVGVAYYRPKEVKNLSPLIPLTELYPEPTAKLARLPYGGVLFNQCLVNLDLTQHDWQVELQLNRESVRRAFAEEGIDYPE